MVLAVRGDVRSQRGIAGLCELNQHPAHGFGEGFIKLPSRESRDLRMI